MSCLNFYTVDKDYVQALQNAEAKQRGFSRVPNMSYDADKKPKFLCGIVLKIHDMDYYVPVSSFKDQKPDNFVIFANNGKAVSSLRFNYMFPVPRNLVTERIIRTEPDVSYRNLLFQELRYCIRNQQTIQQLAERTYRRVLLGFDAGLVVNSCDFNLLEQECRNYIQGKAKDRSITSDTQKIGMKEQISKAQTEAIKREAARTSTAVDDPNKKPVVGRDTPNR